VTAPSDIITADAARPLIRVLAEALLDLRQQRRPAERGKSPPRGRRAARQANLKSKSV
jgi:hypothetical protein